MKSTNQTKTELTQSDHECLDAARGLDLVCDLPGRQNANKHGLKPSVNDYNLAIKRGIYIGRIITPVGAPSVSNGNENV